MESFQFPSGNCPSKRTAEAQVPGFLLTSGNTKVTQGVEQLRVTQVSSSSSAVGTESPEVFDFSPNNILIFSHLLRLHGAEPEKHQDCGLI